MKLNAEQIQDSLSNFTGTDGYHRITIVPHLVATDGVAWLAENAQCYWLIDEIALAQMHPKVRSNKRLQEIQFWTLKVEGSRGTLICEEDEGKPAHAARESAQTGKCVVLPNQADAKTQ